jgi:biotin transport system ATP-binding protein
MTTDIIVIENLTHRFADGNLGLDRVNLRIPRGSFVVIAGANGSGKTTLLRHLNGLLSPESGEVRVDGRRVSDDPLRARQKVGMVFQDADSQIVGETVWDDAAFGPRNLGMPASRVRRRVDDALAQLELSALAHKPPYLLSGGEKRRLAIAGVLAMEPLVVVFDEPFSNLDYPGVRQVLSQMAALHAGGRTVVVTTHDLEKVLALADRLVLIERGRIVKDGAPGEVIKAAETFGVREPWASRMGMGVVSWLS